MKRFCSIACQWGVLGFSFLVFFLTGCAQGDSSTGVVHKMLPEQYIWFGTPSLDVSTPRFFRRSFTITTVPAQATLYFMGPFNFDIFVNGTNISHVLLGGPILHDRPVVTLSVAENLHPGSNTVAVEASASDVFAMKLLPAAQGGSAKALVLSDASWKATLYAPMGWEQASFDDNSWGAVQSFGSIESDPHRFRGNFDLGMYQWPGYQGLSALLYHTSIEPVSTKRIGPYSLLFDFGKEVSGRLEIVSSAQQPVQLQMNFGESENEATPETSFLGTRALIVPPGETTHGPLTAFRFALVVFVSDPEAERFVHFRVDQVLRNVRQDGSFECSDQLLNQVWNTSVYTALLGMQEVYWDAPKRDRNPFSGDLFVAGRTVQVAFGRQPIVLDTLNDLLRRVCIVEAFDITCQNINGIPSYSAWWVSEVADQYRLSGDLTYVKGHRDDLLRLLDLMTRELNHDTFDPTTMGEREYVFADQSPGMIQVSSAAPIDALAITTFVYCQAFADAAFLFQELGDSDLATSYAQTAANIKKASLSTYLDRSTGTFGSRTQTNAMAVMSGVASPEISAAIFDKILIEAPAFPVSPYFDYFVISAMAQTGHREEALSLIRQVWGSMLTAGATSFWEVYDPSCPSSSNYHACLLNFVNTFNNQRTPRYYISLAHAWSSGPAPWLHQEILGIRPLTPGFNTIQIRPDLAGLQWAHGSEPTPFGIISISIQSGATRVELELPAGMEAFVSLPTKGRNSVVKVNGVLEEGIGVENGTRTMIHLSRSSHSHFLLESL